MKFARVIDADSHVMEPRSAWKNVPEEQRPHIELDDMRFEHVFVEGREILTASLGLIGTPGAKMSDFGSHRVLEEAAPAGFDPEIRVREMDAEGIDACVLYPSLGLYFWAVAEPATAVVLARAYNDWLAAYCSTHPERLFGAAMLPLQDPRAAAKELRRAHADLGFRVAFVRPNPCAGRDIAHPDNEVVWETAEELGVTIGVHEGTSNVIPTLATDRMITPFIFHVVSHSFEQMLACAQLIAFGVLERHPALHVVFVEAGGGWVPYWLERLDEQVHGFGDFNPQMRLTPSEYFARQCWVSCEPDERTLTALVPLIGEDRLVWGSDYPHHDSTWPGVLKELRETIEPLSEEVQRKIVGENARALYRLP